MTREQTTFTVDIHDTQGRFTLREVCERGGCHAEFIINLVSHGVITPVEEAPREADWQFDAAALARLGKALRLQRDLDINLPGLAMSLDLLDEVESMRREVDRLRHRLRQLSADW
ncbi:MAG TPA: molecular chaperone [Marinobacter sp.]|jgi:chaperone modulatory protein CbpM|nr:molecular chaperone [Marinobacter sp.]